MSESHVMERGGSQRDYNNPQRLSSVAVESADIVLDERKMYSVEWREGNSFGFTVTPVASDRGTVLLLVRRTAQRAQLEASGLQDIVPGDMLIAVGDEKVYHLGAENAAKYIRSVKKPVRLTMQVSPYGNTAKTVPELAPNEFNYLWEDGPLGIVLTYDLKSKLPMVKRLSDKANEIVRRDVDVGDQLIYANDLPSSEYSMDEVMSLLREIPKPVLLRFRKQLADDHLVELPELAENEYEFLWDYGPLGLVIGMSRNGLPFVRSFTGMGTSHQMPLVQEDDEIVMVNDRSARDDGFREIMQYLMNVPKPAVLRFRRKSHHDNDKAADDRGSNSSSEAARQERTSAMQRGSSPAAAAAQRHLESDRNSSLSSSSSSSRNNKQQLSVSVPVTGGPLSPLATSVRVSVPNYPTAPMDTYHQQPPSPQVHVSLDRSRFSSVSFKPNARISGLEQFGRDTVTKVDERDSTGRSSAQSQESTAATHHGAVEYVAQPTMDEEVVIGVVADEEDTSLFQDARSPERGATETRPFADDRETSILPPDPRMNSLGSQGRSSIFSFRFDESPQLTAAPATASVPERKLSERTVSMPPQPPTDSYEAERRAANGTFGRSQSSRGSRPSNKYEDPSPIVADPVPLRASSQVPAAATSAEARSKERSSRSSKPSVVDTSAFVAEPAPVKAARPSLSKQPVETAAPAAVNNQREQSEKAVTRNTRPSRGNNQFEDTADLVADPSPAKPVVKKAYIDTAELFAEPPKKSQKHPIVDTAELVADPIVPVKNAVAAPRKQQYEDTAELFAEPTKITAAKKQQYVDTADLVTLPAAAAPVKKPFIDTAELFAEPPKQVAPVLPPPVAPAVVEKVAPRPPPVAPPADGQEFFQIDEAAFYTVQWTDGPFGSTVREAESSTGPVMLITKRTGKHTCAGLRRIAVGDILVRIGDQYISTMGFEKATRYLRKVPKPVPLTFQAID